MKRLAKHTVPAALFAVVLLVSAVITPKSFVFQHELGLFIALPDYFRDIFSGSFPISNLIGDFLVQFYRFPLIGPLCTAALVLSIFLLSRSIFRKFTRLNEFFAILFSCAAWFVIARSTMPAVAVGILLITGAVRLALIPVKSTVRKAEPKSRAIPLIVATVTAVIISTDPIIGNLESWGRIEIAAKEARWNDVLKAATPEKAAKDRDMVPFALLASGCKGQMNGALGKYKVANPGEMDFIGVQNRRGYYFESLLAEQLGCTNEAIHNIFQCGCHMHRGTSFSVLTLLIRYNIELGNYSLVCKYANILSHSPAYASEARKVLDIYTGKEDLPVDGGPADQALSTTENPMFNLVYMEKCGIDSPITKPRYDAYAILVKKVRKGR